MGMSDSLSRASDYHQIGYFEGSARICEKLRPSEDSAGILRHLNALNRFYLDRSRQPGLLPEFEYFGRKLQGGQHFCELALLNAQEGRMRHAVAWVKVIARTLDEQMGRLIFHRVTPVLELAEFASTHQETRTEAIRLLNVALSAPTYVLGSDLRRLANLLSLFRAPVVLWSDWCAHFVKHLSFSGWRQTAMVEVFRDEEGAKWAFDAQEESRRVLVDTLSIAPSELLSMLIEIAPRLQHPQLPEILRTGFRAGAEGHPESIDPLFWSSTTCRCRFPWFEYLDEMEKNFLINGEWALFCAPTPDHSMGLAQWWRTVESTLKRAVIAPLAAHLQQKGELIVWDRTNLSKNQQKKESLFIDTLADPHKSARVTLGQILLILQKCVEKPDSVQSKLRLEASEFLAPYVRQTESLVQEEFLRPVKLTQANVDYFRNQASHAAAISMIDAAVGRTLARLIINDFFAPAVSERTWRFTVNSEEPNQE